MSAAIIKKGIHVLSPEKNVRSFIEDVASISDQEKSFIICDIGEIVARYQEWRKALPRVTPFFAVKSNDHSIVLKTLNALGSGFDCSSKLEIDKVLGMGVCTNRIVFSHTTKLVSYLRYAAEKNVSLMTFDNEEELYKIKEHYPGSRLLLRFRCDDETAIAKLGIKFGCDPETEAAQLLNLARDLKLNVVGVCFHIGSGSGNPQIFHLALRYAREIFDIAKSLEYNFNILDIGGGYLGFRTSSIDPYAKVINNALEEYFPESDLTVLSEPGAFLVSSSGTIAVNIHSLRTVRKKGNNGNSVIHNMYYINDGYYGSFNIWLTHEHTLDVEPLRKNENSDAIKSTVWGPTCDSRDIVWKGDLPQMKRGDWLIVHDMGDYTFKAPSEFNGFLKADIYFVVSEKIRDLLKDISAFTSNDFFEGSVFEKQ